MGVVREIFAARAVNEQPHAIDAAVDATAKQVAFVVPNATNIAVAQQIAIAVFPVPALQHGFVIWPTIGATIEPVNAALFLILTIPTVIEIRQGVWVCAIDARRVERVATEHVAQVIADAVASADHF